MALASIKLVKGAPKPEAIEMQLTSNIDLIGMLALYQNRRDTAIGLTHITAKQRGLLWYRNVKEQELSQSKAALQQIAQEALRLANSLNKSIETNRAKMKSLIAQSEQAKDSRPLVSKAMRLQKQVEQAEEMLAKIANGKS